MKLEKLGHVFSPDNVNNWWKSHCMAPAPMVLDDKTIRVYVGAWSEGPISRIGYVDVDSHDPRNVRSVSDTPILDIGRDGTFDENGVFPGHVTRIDNKVYLYYTGFQLGHKIRHYNFGGLAISEDGGLTFVRHSEAPLLDRTEEGLFVRAGQSLILTNEGFASCYSAGSGWAHVGGRPRPCYDVYLQHSNTPDCWAPAGEKIVTADQEVEHGLGRPQLIEVNGTFYVFYTRRLRSMRYGMGAAMSKDLKNWQRIDEDLELPFGKAGEFDEHMVYFPAVVRHQDGDYLFYSGNEFGKGLGVAKITSWTD